MQYCSLQHWTLLLSPVTSTTGYCFCFGSIPSFFLELFLHRSPVAYWAPTDLGSSSFSVLSFLSFHSVHGVLKARILKWFAITFSRGLHSVWPLHHDPSVLGGPTRHDLVSWVRQDCGPVIRLASFLWLWFSVSALWCPLATPTVSLGFLLPWTRGISSPLPLLTLNVE